MRYPAHFRRAADGSIEIQTVSEHNRNTAEIAAERLRGVRLAKTGYLAGLLHDCGKYQLAYSSYLEKIMAGERGAPAEGRGLKSHCCLHSPARGGRSPRGERGLK